LYVKCCPAMVRGRFANVMSFLVKHSSTAEGEDTTSIDLKPSLRERIGPYCDDRVCSAWWSGCLLRRWRWPIIGRENGLGGRFLLRWFRILTMKIMEKSKARYKFLMAKQQTQTRETKEIEILF